jgi:hypothetical protein
MVELIVCDLLPVTFMAPKILGLLLDFGKNCAFPAL